MNILLSNDDGVYAPGLRALHKEVSSMFPVKVVAPDRDRSAASKSLTVSKPLRPKEIEPNFISVDGTPTDCVHIALTGYLEQTFDMVVAGINSGPNLGDDVLYSGTVAAASEGRTLGYPSIAMSLVSDTDGHYDTAAQVAVFLIRELQKNPLPADTILNVNVPDLPLSEIRGYSVTRLGMRHPSEHMFEATDPRGRPVYWIGPAGAEQDAGEGTDFYAVRHGYVSITPLQMDLTRYQMLEDLKPWAARLPYENL